MDRIKTLSRRDFLKLSGFLAASAALSACAKEVPIFIPTPERTAVPTWTLPPSIATEIALTPTSTTSPTLTPSKVPETSTPTATTTPEPEKIPEFVEPKIGNIDLKNPFQIYLPKETAALATIWAEKYFAIDVPVVVEETELTDEEIKLMDPHNIPWDSNDPNSRVGLIFQTNNPNNLMIYAHTGYSFMGQELPLNFLRKIVRDHPDELIGRLRFSLVQVDEVVNLEVVDYTVITDDFFDLAFANYKDDDNPLKRNVPLFLRFGRVCDENDVCIDINPYPNNTGEKLITFVGCAGPIGDVASERMIVTARIVN